MLEINKIRTERESVLVGLQKRNFPSGVELIDGILELDDARKSTQQELDATLARLNKISKQIGSLMREGKKEEANQAKEKTTALKSTSKDLQEQLNRLESDLQQALYQLPNIPHELVVAGTHAEQNEIIKSPETLPQLPAEKKPHWELATSFDIIDFELGNKITGAGFPVYKGAGARLQRALINFFLDQAVEAGYVEVQPPVVINEESGYGTGQLPDKEGQMYQLTDENFYLIPTAEVPVTNFYRQVILEATSLPVKHVAYTPCFRREAGSWGAHVRGLNRLHQFDKVELVQLTTPESSYDTLDDMVAYVSGLLEKLQLPYRVLRLCGGDMGFTSAMTYDLEVYSAGQERWLEVSSVSNFETYQANRLKLRYRKEDKKTQLVHTLNGSALALPRIVAALLENNQQDNRILLPEILKPYMKTDQISLPG